MADGEPRKINAIGLDTTNLERLAAKVSMVVATSMNIRGDSGGPLRIVAFVERVPE